jgi:hypothetical protein
MNNTQSLAHVYDQTVATASMETHTGQPNQMPSVTPNSLIAPAPWSIHSSSIETNINRPILMPPPQPRNISAASIVQAFEEELDSASAVRNDVPSSQQSTDSDPPPPPLRDQLHTCISFEQQATKHEPNINTNCDVSGITPVTQSKGVLKVRCNGSIVCHQHGCGCSGKTPPAEPTFIVSNTSKSGNVSSPICNNKRIKLRWASIDHLLETALFENSETSPSPYLYTREQRGEKKREYRKEQQQSHWSNGGSASDNNTGGSMNEDSSIGDSASSTVEGQPSDQSASDAVMLAHRLQIAANNTRTLELDSSNNPQRAAALEESKNQPRRVIQMDLTESTYDPIESTVSTSIRDIQSQERLMGAISPPHHANKTRDQVREANVNVNTIPMALSAQKSVSLDQAALHLPAPPIMRTLSTAALRSNRINALVKKIPLHSGRDRVSQHGQRDPFNAVQGAQTTSISTTSTSPLRIQSEYVSRPSLPLPKAGSGRFKLQLSFAPTVTVKPAPGRRMFGSIRDVDGLGRSDRVDKKRKLPLSKVLDAQFSETQLKYHGLNLSTDAPHNKKRVRINDKFTVPRTEQQFHGPSQLPRYSSDYPPFNANTAILRLRSMEPAQTTNVASTTPAAALNIPTTNTTHTQPITSMPCDLSLVNPAYRSYISESINPSNGKLELFCILCLKGFNRSYYAQHVPNHFKGIHPDVYNSMTQQRQNENFKFSSLHGSSTRTCPQETPMPVMQHHYMQLRQPAVEEQQHQVYRQPHGIVQQHTMSLSAQQFNNAKCRRSNNGSIIANPTHPFTQTCQSVTAASVQHTVAQPSLLPMSQSIPVPVPLPVSVLTSTGQLNGSISTGVRQVPDDLSRFFEHGGGMLRCPLCDAVFSLYTTDQYLRAHIHNNHPNNK